MSWEQISNLIGAIELSLRQFFSVFARLVDYKSLINVGELMAVVWAIGVIGRIRVKPKKVETKIIVEKTIKE